MATKADLVTYECVDRIAIIRLNRPEKMNAFSDDLVMALSAALHRLDTDPTANVAILTGNGRAFSTGADVNQRQLRTREELLLLGGPEGLHAKAADVFTRAVNWKPVIAAAHGYAIGMALGFMLCCDMVVAEEGTQLQVTETPRGLSGVRYAHFLQLLGNGTFAYEVSMTGAYFSAQRAFEAGVINRLAPAGTYLKVAHDLAMQVADMPPLSVRAIVWARRLKLDQIERDAAMVTDPLKLHLSDDFRESALAFVEKRPRKPMQGR